MDFMSMDALLSFLAGTNILLHNFSRILLIVSDGMHDVNIHLQVWIQIHICLVVPFILQEPPYWIGYTWGANFNGFTKYGEHVYDDLFLRGAPFVLICTKFFVTFSWPSC